MAAADRASQQKGAAALLHEPSGGKCSRHNPPASPDPDAGSSTGDRYLKNALHSRHPLAERLETDGIDPFISKYGRLINLSQSGQLAIRECLEAHLRRVEHDARGFADLKRDYGLEEGQVEEAIRYELLAA